MPTGFQDWINPFNLAAQALAEAIVRPKYGSAQVGTFTTNSTPNSSKEVLSISGTGMIYGGAFRSEPAQSQKDDAYSVIIDGNFLGGFIFSFLNSSLFTPMYSDILYLLRYDDVAFRYFVGIGYGFTFESSITIKYVETEGNTIPLGGRLYYALI